MEGQAGFTVLRLLGLSAGTRWYRKVWLLGGGPLTFTFHPPPRRPLMHMCRYPSPSSHILSIHPAYSCFVATLNVRFLDLSKVIWVGILGCQAPGMRPGWDLWAPCPVSRGKAGGKSEPGRPRQWTWAGVSLACIYSEAMTADNKKVAFVNRSQKQRLGQSGSSLWNLHPAQCLAEWVLSQSWLSELWS